MKRVIKLEIKGKTEKITIRHVKKSDVEGVWNNFNAVVEEGIYLPVFLPVRSEFEKRSWFENIKRENEVCIVANISSLKSPHNIVGQCEISNIEWEASTHVGSLGIIVRIEFRDLGIGLQLIDLAIRESKRINNKEKIILSCFSSNERALNLYEKLGFQEIGRRKKQFYMDSTYSDEVLMDLWIDDYIEEQDLE